MTAVTSADSPLLASAPPFLSDIVQVMVGLTEILKQETELLLQMRVSEIGPLQERKTRLAEAYAQSHRTLSADPAPVKMLPPQDQEHFRDLARTLDTVSRENGHALRASEQAIRKVVDRFVGAVKRQAQAPNAYTRTGAMNYGPKAMAARRVSISLREDI